MALDDINRDNGNESHDTEQSKRASCSRGDCASLFTRSVLGTYEDSGVSDTLNKNCRTSTRWTLMVWHNYLPEKLLSPQHPETANQVTARHCSCRVSGAKMRNDNRGTDFLADSLKIFWGSVSFDKNPLHTSLKENLAADHPSVSDRSM